MTVTKAPGVAGSGASFNVATAQSSAPAGDDLLVHEIENDWRQESEIIYPAEAQAFLGMDGSRCTVPVPQLRERKQEAHKVRPHETLDMIAELILGSLASKAQLQTFKTAIRDLNVIAKKDDVVKGRMLKMPGISKTGDFIYSGNGISSTWSSYDGSVQTISKDGTRTVNYRDGRTVMRTGDGTEYVTNADQSTEIRTTDGTIIRRDKSGETITKDGITREFDLIGSFKKWSKRLRNGGTFQAGPDGSVGFFEKQSGDRKEQNYSLRESLDGIIEVTNDGSEEVLRFPADETIASSRETLLDLARKIISEPELLSKFKADMVRFENRLAERGLSSKEIEKTYSAIKRLLDPSVNGKVSFGARVVLAQQVMGHAAVTSGIDQGYHKTGNIVGIETRAYTRRPSAVANFIAECAVEGKYGITVTMTNWGIEPKPACLIEDGTATGKYTIGGFSYELVVNVPERSLYPDCEAAYNPPPDGHRSFASQIYQVAAINAVYADNDQSIRYEQTRPALSAQAKDTGERLFDVSYYPPKEIARQPNLSSKDIARSYELVTGEACKAVILENSLQWGESSYPGVVTFSTERELAARLTQAKREDNLPILLTIHSGNEPFYSDSGNGAAGGAGAWHAVIVADFDERTGGVYIDNQWGSTADHLSKPVPLVEIFQATLPPDHAY